MWLRHVPKFNFFAVEFLSPPYFSLMFALAFEGFVSSPYLFLISWLFHMCRVIPRVAFFSPSSLIELASDSETNLKTGCLFTLYTFCSRQSPPLHLIPPDENLVGHIKVSALGPAALDLRESDLLLVLWSLSQCSLKGLLQSSSNNPLLSVQVEQRGTTI